MKLHLERASGRNLFTGYDVDHVEVNGQRWAHSLIVLPEHLEAWAVSRLDDLGREHIARLALLPIEILLLGTGRKLRFPAGQLLQPLREAGIGVELMDTHAACRTYNILLGEERKVGAAVILETAG